mmetsp:Transcript_37709/g.81756  ORF Transcript_37709/g.81756 Transcript_37709/m.81756 type:complete len:83 (-) Transcript_37709:27-275(-)
MMECVAGGEGQHPRRSRAEAKRVSRPSIHCNITGLAPATCDDSNKSTREDGDIQGSSISNGAALFTALKAKKPGYNSEQCRN